MTSDAALSHTSAALHRRTRAGHLLGLGIIAVDLYRFWLLPVMLAFLEMGVVHFSDMQRVSMISYHGLCGILAFMAGLALINDDHERGTLWLWRAQPVSPVRILIQKFIVGLILIALFLVLCEGGLAFRRLFHVNHYGLLLPTLGSAREPSMWNFGVSWSLSFALFTCLLAVGLAAGAVFENFVVASLVGFGIYVAWYASWAVGFRFLESANRVSLFRAIMVAQQFLLAAAAAWVFLRAIRWPGTWGRLRHGGEEAVPNVTAALPAKPRWLGTNPWARRVLSVGIALTIFTWAATYILVKFFPSHKNYLFAAWHLAAPALFGSLLFSKIELSGLNCPLYWQPVSRWQLLAPRLAVAVPILILQWTIALILANNFEGQPFVGICQAIGIALLAAMFRLFVRNPIFCAVLAFLLGGTWSFLIMRNGSNGRLAEDLTGAVWTALIVLILPACALWLTYCRSNLLNQSGRRRSVLCLSVAITIALLGYFLLFTQPMQLLWLIGHALTRYFAPEVPA